MFNGIRQRVSNIIAPTANGRKMAQKNLSNMLDPLWTLNARQSGSYLERNKFGAAVAMNITVPLYTCVNLRTKAVGKTNWTLKDLSGEIIYESATGQGEGNLISRAINDFELKFNMNFFSMWELSRVVAGETFIYFVPSMRGVITGLEWLNPLVVKPFAPAGEIIEYWYQPQGGRLTIPLENMLFDRQINLLDETTGQSPVEVALRKIQIIISGDDTMLAHLRNNARAGMSVSPVKATTQDPSQGVFTQEEMDMIQDSMMKNARGAHNHNSTMVFPFPVDFETFEIAQVAPVIELMDRVDKSIYEILNVPPAIAGNPDTSRFQRSDQDVVVYHEMLTNECEDIQGYMNRVVIPRLDPLQRTVFEFDLSPYQHLSEEDLKLAELSNMLLASGQLNREHAIQLNAGVLRRKGLNVEEVIAAEPEAHPLDEPVFESGRLSLPRLRNRETPYLNAPKAKQMDTGKAFAYIPLFNNSTIRFVQRELKAMFQADDIEWQIPATYHITLAFAQELDDVGISAIVGSMSVEKMDILFDMSEPFGVFDTPDGQVLHLRVEPEASTMINQRNIYEGFVQRGSGISEFSDPKDWNPHVTLAYFPNNIKIDLDALSTQFFDALSVVIEADEVIIGRDDYDPIAIMTAPKIIKQQDSPHSIDVLLARGVDGWNYDLAKKELNQLHKFIRNQSSYIRDNGKLKKRFRPTYTRGDIFETVSETFDSGVVKLMLAEIDRQVSYLDTCEKSIGGLRNEFKNRFNQILEDATSAGQLNTLLDALVTRSGRRAYSEGLEASGVRDDPDDNDEARIGAVQARQSKFIDEFSERMFSDNPYTEAQLETKAEQWSNKTLDVFYYEGLLSGRRNPMLQWQLNPEKENCSDCRRLDGQRHRALAWKAADWQPKSSRLECTGQLCGCDLLRTRGRSRGRF